MTLTKRPIPPMLECHDIHKRFGGVLALQGVSLDIAPGEIVGLIGPNGSGKSTLLHCLGGATRPSDGRVMLAGRDVTGFKPYRLARMGLARTFQQNRIFRQLTVLENVLASRDWSAVGPLRQIRSPEAEVVGRAQWLLERAGLKDHQDHHGEDLSGGQRRLLEIAMALMPSPKVLMLDEATSGVNPSMIDVFVQYLTDINRQEGCAIVIVEHNLQFVTDLATRVWVLDQGRVLVQGNPQQVLADPRVVEAYLGG